MVKLGLRDEPATEVDGLHHAACRQDAQHRVEVGVVGDDGELQGRGEALARRHVQDEPLQRANGVNREGTDRGNRATRMGARFQPIPPFSHYFYILLSTFFFS